MLRHEYQTLFDLEESYWWFRSLRGVLVDTCRQLGLSASSRILDAGCGTGKTAETLAEAVSPSIYGFDLSPLAAGFAHRRRFGGVCRASVNAIPFGDASFDAAICIDVFECDGVDEQQAYRELCRVVRPGGFLLILVPAFRWLMSPEHHRAVGASRRYTRSSLRALLAGASTPMRLRRMTHLFMGTLPPIAAYRLWKRIKPDQRADPSPRSELRTMPGWANQLLFNAVAWERHVPPSVELPVGSSILAVVQKDPVA